MEFMGTIAGGVAHDLNNILSGIVSYPDLLLIQLPDIGEIREDQTINHKKFLILKEPFGIIN